MKRLLLAGSVGIVVRGRFDLLPINQIITGDCIKVMGSFPEESIGMILTSPPYNVGLKYDGFDDNLPEDEFREFNKEWLAGAFRVIEDTGRMYSVISDKMLWWFKDLSIEIGWNFIQPLVWCKPNLIGGTKRITGDWNIMTENILLFRKGERTSMLKGGKNVNTFNWFKEVSPQSNHKGGRHHPAQMPFSLCQKIISRTPGDPILDPFCGSGQVLRAARSLKRNYIGIDLVSTVTEKARDFVNGEIYRLPEQAKLGFDEV